MPLATVLRETREARGLSRDQLAARAGLSPAAIGHLENQTRVNPQASTIVRLSRALNVPADWLLTSNDR